jgi:hypothetical protein
MREAAQDNNLGGGGEGERVQKWGRNDNNNEYDAYDVGRSIWSNACIIAGGLVDKIGHATKLNNLMNMLS